MAFVRHCHGKQTLSQPPVPALSFWPPCNEPGRGTDPGVMIFFLTDGERWSAPPEMFSWVNFNPPVKHML